MVEMQNAFDGFISSLDRASGSLWAWGYANRNFPNWNTKRENVKEGKRTEQNIQEQ